MSFSVSEIQSALQFGGARPSLFQVQIMNPVTTIADLKSPFLVRGSELPPSVLGQIEVPYFGRHIKVAGSRTYDNWSVTVINDEDFLVRRAIEQWSKVINDYAGNINEFGTSAPSEYKSTAQVTQYGQTGNVLRVYQMNGIFPTNIGAIELDWDNGSQIEVFRVDFAMDLWQVVGDTP